jgi:hypothetical protein
MRANPGAVRVIYSGTAKLGWIVVGRRVVVVGAEATRNGVVAIDPLTIRSDVAWDPSPAGTNGKGTIGVTNAGMKSRIRMMNCLSFGRRTYG